MTTCAGIQGLKVRNSGIHGIGLKCSGLFCHLGASGIRSQKVLELRV